MGNIFGLAGLTQLELPNYSQWNGICRFLLCAQWDARRLRSPARIGSQQRTIEHPSLLHPPLSEVPKRCLQSHHPYSLLNRYCLIGEIGEIGCL